MRVGVYPGLRPRLVTGDPHARTDWAAHRPVAAPAGDLIAAVERAGLRGRGGAAFPAAIKLRTVRDAPGPRVVVANGEEGEPASIKDRWLLRLRPHLVLDGLLLAADAVGADRAIVYVSDDAAADSVRLALDERPVPPVAVEVFEVDRGYVAGEESAVVRALSGGPAKPTTKPPRPFQSGVDEQPTLVANVETLANLPCIAAAGPDTWRAAGTAQSPGTFLLTLSGACAEPGLYEAALGTTIDDAVDAVGGGYAGEPRGFLLGGFFAGLANTRYRTTALCYEALRMEGAGLGCGAVVVLGPDDCAVAAAADVLSFFERENARQCGACMRGTAAMRDVVLELERGVADPARVEKLAGWSQSLRGRGACQTLDGAAILAGSLLREFPLDVDAHLSGGCPLCATKPPTDPQAESRFSVAVADTRIHV
jgi:NADH:ubiquinone oxidoreductase subunit F (NADH-binding)